MTVYVDNARNRLGRMRMAHMVADTLIELHEMAARIGLRYAWFQDHVGSYPHYDLCQSKRAMVLGLGAKEVTQKQVIMLIREWRKNNAK